MLPRHWLRALALLIVTLAAPAVGYAAWPTHATQAVPLCRAAGAQDSVRACGDGAGGAIVVWQDRRGATYDVYAARILYDGSLAAGWTAEGVAVCTAASDQVNPVITADGVGGAVIAWSDSRGDGTTFDIYAQRLSTAGAPLWTANGVALCTQVNDQKLPQIVGDGNGGAVLTWLDRRANAGTSDIYALRVNGAGGVAPGWTAQGTAICTATNLQTRPMIVSDGAGGGIIAWQDRRAGNSDIYAQRVGAAGAVGWGANGQAVCLDDSVQARPTLVGDGEFGAIIAWEDGRRTGSDSDIYAQRINYAGTPVWTSNGVALCMAAQNQYGLQLVSDGFNGAIVGWTDGRAGNDDIYAQQVTGGGGVAWATNGVAVSDAPGSQVLFGMAPDAGTFPGALFAWEDGRNPSGDLFAGRIRQTGNAPYCWNLGVPLATAVGPQLRPALVTDGHGGAIVAYADGRLFQSGQTPDVSAIRLDGQLGFIGDPAPQNVRADDVPQDQGGHVRVRWTPSFLDTREPTYDGGCACGRVDRYLVWRHVAPFNATEAMAAGAGVLIRGAAAEPVAGRRVFRTTPSATQTNYWELVASETAAGLGAYSLIVPTPYDSVAGDNPGVILFVQAVARSGAPAGTWGSLDPKDTEANEDCEAEWDSDHTTTSSSDNRAPAPPFPFLGAYTGNVFLLHWKPSDAPDLDFYRVYRGTDPQFTPGQANLLSTVVDTTLTDAPGAYYYKLSAVDIHGNESEHTLLRYRDIAGAPEAGGVPALWLAHATPNPFNSATHIVFGLPRAASAMLTIHDVAGRLVRRLVDGPLGAGAHDAAWDGRDDTGRAMPGSIYFYRLSAEGATQAGRVVLQR